MALTVGRWFAAVGLGSAGLAVALLPPKPSERPPLRPPSTEVQASARLETRLRQAYDHLHSAEMEIGIDSLVRNGLPVRKYPVILPLGGAPSATRDSLQEQIRRSWPAVPGNGHDSIPMYIVLNGTASNQDWQSEYLLPDSINGAACVTLLKSDAWVRARGDSALLRTLLDETGPCIWYSTYGMPGPSISHWIRGNGISLMTRYDLPGQRDSVELDGDFGYFVPGMVYQASENLLTCLTGDETVCARLVMGRATRRDSTNYRIVTPEWFYRLPMGGESSAWLSDLQREMGFERFSRFWHSELPMTQAFQHAFGMEPGVWNREWLSRTYPEIYPGPLPRGRSVAYAGGVMLLLFGLAAAVAVRKVS